MNLSVLKHLILRNIGAVLLTAVFSVPFSVKAQNCGNEWDRMIRLNTVSERNGIYKMPAPSGNARVYISDVSVKCGKTDSKVIYSSASMPDRAYIVVSKESPAVKPGDKVTLNISFSGDIDGISAFAYADLDMDGIFEKVLCSSKKAKDSMSVGIKVPKDSRQEKIRVRVRYTSDLSADGADTPVRDGKCYDFVLYVVD